MLKPIRFWSRVAAGNAAGALLAALVFTSATWQTPWRRILGATAINFVFSFCCSSLGFLTIPRIAPLVRRHIPAPLNWAVVAAALVGCAIAGSFIGMLVVAIFGVVPDGRFLAMWTSVLKTAIYFTLIFGIFMTVTFGLRARLEDAALALRTKERDEAEARRLAAEAQLASLESRVQPHFLFNTLNSIAALIHEDPGGAEKMTGQLASLLRSSLDAQSSPLVSIDDELRIVRDYLEIERVRFGQRLRFAIDVDDAARAAHVPRLAVQTLVENSVKYAVSPRRDGAAIAIRVTGRGARARVEVEDNGPGFDASAVSNGHGLALVRSRLQMTYGDRASLGVESVPGRTVVSLDLPMDQ